mgnify:CR=1 FL=1
MDRINLKSTEIGVKEAIPLMSEVDLWARIYGNQADNDETIPNTLYLVMYTQTARRHLWNYRLMYFCHLNMFLWHNDIENVCV